MSEIDKDLLAIKFRTYKKCKKQLVIGLLLFVTGLFLMYQKSLLTYLPLVVGFYLTVSSFFGILSNKPSSEQLDVLNKEEDLI